jgi:plastocyanin
VRNSHGLQAFAAGAAIAWIAAFGGGCGAQGHGPAVGRPAPRAPVLHVVTIQKLAFEPGLVEAAPGDTIVWRNEDLVPHTVTARSGAWGSGNLPPDSTWRWVVAGNDSAAYACTYHTTMHGAVRIVARP